MAVAAAVAMSGLPGCAGALRERPGADPGVPRALEGDVSAGYRAYATTLERWGRWSADPLYAVRWCPHGIDPATFVPYRADGHWSASTGDAKSWNAPPGAPYWLSDDSETWGDITMHHGWWVHVEEGPPSGAWCWIPGAAETAGRVVWRTADGFVGWAPEPPSDDVADDAEIDDTAWSYELLGTLFDEILDPALLVDDAAAVAREATRAARHDPAHPGSPRRVGPGSSQVAAARKALASYVLAHPEVASDGSGSNAKTGQARTPTASARGADSSSASTGSRSSPATGSIASSSTTTSTSTTASSSTTSSHASTEETLPPSMVLYDQILRDPYIGGMGAGPAGMGPGVIGGIAPSPYLPFLNTNARAVARVGGSSGSASASRSYAAPSATSHTGSSSSGHSSSTSSTTSSGKSHGK